MTAAGVMVSMAGVSCTAAAQESAATPAAHAGGSQAAPGAQLWVSRYNGPGNSFDVVAAIAVSPDGRIVFVTGWSVGASNNYDYATIAYSASTGQRLWLRRYPGSADGFGFAKALVVSQDGKTVFVTGYSGAGYTTIAYNAATGARRWISVFKGNNQARNIAIGPDGKTLYVTGRGYSTTSHWDDLTVAYDAATGAQRWAARYNGPRNSVDAGGSLAVTPDGRTVIVAGPSVGPNSGPGTLIGRTAAPSTSLATLLATAVTTTTPRSPTRSQPARSKWLSTYNGPGNKSDEANALALSPDGSTLYVTGFSARVTTTGFAAIAYQT